MHLVKLTEADRDVLLDFYLSLSSIDKKLRFCGPTKDESIIRYVKNVNFSVADIYVWTKTAESGDTRTVGVIELIPHQNQVEIAIALSDAVKGKGNGAALFEKAIALASTMIPNIQSVEVHTLFDNLPMLALAQRNGMHIKRDGADIVATKQVLGMKDAA